MFKPKYDLSAKILGNIAQIERFYGQLESLRIPRKLELNLERNNLIQSSYISNSVEGNPLTHPEVTNLLLNDRVPANRNEKEIKNYFDILKSFKAYIHQELSITLVKKIHYQLLRGVDEEIAGQIRDKSTVVGRQKNIEGKPRLYIKHNPPFHKRQQIEKALHELFDWLKRENQIPVAIKTGVFHHQFVFLHPFSDGNGRVCRLLTALIFLNAGYLINKYFVLDDWYDIDRLLYSDKLHSADSGDKTEWLEYFTDGIKYSLQSALGKFKSSLKTLAFEIRPTAKEKEVLKILEKIREMTAPELAGKLRVTRQQAYNLLISLVNKGFLERKGQTKSSYYFLK